MIATSGVTTIVVAVLIVLVGSAFFAALIGPGRGWDRRKAFIVGLCLGIAGLAIVFLFEGSSPEPGALERQRQREEWEEQQRHGTHPMDGPLPPTNGVHDE